MRSKTPSSGDRLLLEELARRGRDISLTRIERWRYWRKTGLVPRTIQHGKGRGSYSELADLGDAADRVCEVDDLFGRYRDLDDISLVLSARGRPLDPASVKAALLTVLTEMEKAFRSHQSTSDEPLEVAANAARALTRALSRGKGRGSASTRAGAPLPLPPGALLIAARVLAGDPVPTRDLEVLVEQTGLAALAARLGATAGDLAMLLDRVRSTMSFQALRTTVAQADSQAITEALQTARHLFDKYVPAFLIPGETSRDVAVAGCAVAFLNVNPAGQPITDT